MKINLWNVFYFCGGNIAALGFKAEDVLDAMKKTECICENYFNLDKSEEEMEFCNFSCINSLDEEFNKLKLILLNEEDKISRMYMLEKLRRIQSGTPITIGFGLQGVFIFLKLLTNNDQKMIAFILNEFSNSNFTQEE